MILLLSLGLFLFLCIGAADRKMVASHEIKVCNDIYGLMKWYGRLLQDFPRNHRYGVGLRIETNIYDMMNLVNLANTGILKKERLTEANALLQTLKYLVRLIWELRLISELQHHAFIEQMDNIGRQLGGWIRSIHY